MTPAQPTTAADASPPLRVLLVEDDEFDVAVFNRAFRKSGIPCEIVRCRRGEEVLEGLRDADLAVDLLVADHLLPGISGFDLCVKLREAECPFALVLLTGGGTEQMAIRALRAGINDYIVKDSAQEYLELLPLVLPKVARRHRERRARSLATERHPPGEAIENNAAASQVESPPIGLSVCAALVRQRGGRIWVEKGQGTVPTLHFAVPLAPAEADAWRGGSDTSVHAAATRSPTWRAADSDSSPPTPTGAELSRHTLIVHANPIVTFVATRILERLGHRAVAVSDGLKAIEAIDREPFDLVLMGVRLRRPDCRDTTRRIRERERPASGRLPIIALAADPETDFETYRAAGMDDRVPRPIGFDSLRGALARLPGRLR